MENLIKTFIFSFVIGFSLQASADEGNKMLGYYAKHTVKRSLWSYGVYTIPRLSKQKKKKPTKLQKHRAELGSARFQRLIESL